MTLDGHGNRFHYAGKSVAVVLDSSNPIPAGTWDIEIPDEFHDLGLGYSSASRFATTWFRIGHSGDRFLHPGSVTLGCATVTDVSAWTDIYNYLIFARKGDFRSVGQMEVKY